MNSERNPLFENSSTLNGTNLANMMKGDDAGDKQEGCLHRTCGCFIRGEKLFKECLEKAFFQSQAGRYLERLNGVLMLGSSILYVVLSYYYEQ